MAAAVLRLPPVARLLLAQTIAAALAQKLAPLVPLLILGLFPPGALVLTLVKKGLCIVKIVMACQ